MARDVKSGARRPARRSHAEPHAASQAGLPAWLPPVAYAFVTILLFREFFFQRALLLGADTFALSYFARHFYTTFVHTFHRFPMWDPLIFGGLPFVDGMHGDIFYPPSLALFGMETKAMWGWKMVLHVYAAGLLAYLWLRNLEVSRGGAFFGGLVYMSGADLVSLVYPGGDGKLFVSALAPLMFLLTDRFVRNRRISDAALFALGLAMVIFTSHMQLAYFTVWGVSLYFVFRLALAWRTGRNVAQTAGLLGTFLLAGIMGVGAAAVQFLPPLGYLREWSHRADKTLQADGESAYAYSTSYALNPEEVVSLVVPEFVGDNVETELRSGNRYWGRNVFKINSEYAGLVPLLLIPLLFICRRRPETWFFASLAALSVVYGMGASTPLFRLFYLVPGVNLFRAPSLIIFLYGLSVATLGALAVDRLNEQIRTGEAIGALQRATWIVAGVFVLLALAQSAELITSLWQSLTAIGPEKAAALRENMPSIRAGFWITGALAIAVAGVCQAAVRGLVGARGVAIGLAMLAALDLYRVDRPFIRGTVLRGQAFTSAFPAFVEPDESIRFLQGAQARGEVFRVYDLGNVMQGPAYDANTLAIHGVEQLTGHHGNEIGRYRRLMGGADSAPNAATSNLRLLNIANVAYVVSPQRIQFPGLEEVFVGSRSAVYRNINALPRAYLAGATEVIADDAATDRLLAQDFDGARTVILPEPLPAGIDVQADPIGSVTWASREPDRFMLRVTTDRPTLLVVTDNYYPAWHARVDGAEAPILRANLAFRAVPVPAGEHEVAFFYNSETLRRSATVSIALLAILLGLAATGLVRRRQEDAA